MFLIMIICEWILGLSRNSWKTEWTLRNCRICFTSFDMMHNALLCGTSCSVVFSPSDSLSQVIIVASSDYQTRTFDYRGTRRFVSILNLLRHGSFTLRVRGHGVARCGCRHSPLRRVTGTFCRLFGNGSSSQLVLSVASVAFVTILLSWLSHDFSCCFIWQALVFVLSYILFINWMIVRFHDSWSIGRITLNALLEILFGCDHFAFT